MSEENGLLNVNVVICDRSYRLKVKPEEEDAVRKAAKHIIEKVKVFQEQYVGKEKQDYLAMCALMFAIENLNLENKQTSNGSNLQTELELINTQILKAIQS